MKIVKGVRPSPRRIMLYGPHGIGKGTWASKAPSPIFLDIEGGLEDTECERTDRLGSIDQVNEALTWLVSGDHDYKTCVVDTVDWLEQLIHKQIVKDEGKNNVKSIADIGYGKGYARAIPDALGVPSACWTAMKRPGSMREPGSVLSSSINLGRRPASASSFPSTNCR